MKKQLSLIIIFVSVLYFVNLIARHKHFFTRAYDHKLLSQLYSSSQYITGSGSAGIGDDGLYAFAGYYYVTGGDPSSVNFEHPPLGKYMIGASTFLFNNENILYIFYAVLALWGIYLLTMEAYQNKTLASFAVLFMSISKMFVIQFVPTSENQLSVTLLDLPLMIFFIFGLITFLKARGTQIKYVWSSLFFGIAFSVKFFPSLILIMTLLGIYLFLTTKKHISAWLKSVIVVPAVYVISYAAYFYYHPSIVEFFNYQKYIIGWRLGNPVKLGNIIKTIYTGYYKNWWNQEVIRDYEWSWLLPIVVTLGLVSIVFAGKNNTQKLLWWTCVVFISYLGIGTVGVARYLLPIYPILIILSISSIKYIFDILLRLWRRPHGWI